MTSKTSKAPTARNGGALGNVVHGQAINTRVDTTSTFNLQQNWLASRFGLSAERAALLAAFAFGEVRQ